MKASMAEKKNSSLSPLSKQSLQVHSSFSLDDHCGKTSFHLTFESDTILMSTNNSNQQAWFLLAVTGYMREISCQTMSQLASQITDSKSHISEIIMFLLEGCKESFA